MHHARARYCMEAAVAPHGLDRVSSARSFRFHHTCGVCTRFEKVQTGGTYLRRPLHSGRRKVGTSLRHTVFPWGSGIRGASVAGPIAVRNGGR